MHLCKKSTITWPIIVFACLFISHQCWGQSRPPVIDHNPVNVAIRGQPVFIRARVTDANTPIKAVNLYYTTSRDAAPFKIPMQSTGAGSYSCSIPGNLLANVDSMSYYIEAMNLQEANAETPWYNVDVTTIQQANAAGKAIPPTVENERPGWVIPALVVGGVAVVGGGTYAIVSSRGGGSSSGPAVTNFGVYAGSVTTCLTIGGSNKTCESHTTYITVSPDQSVSSPNLRDGYFLQTRLSGNTFNIISPLNGADTKGEIRYVGTVFNAGRIAGYIDGSYQSGQDKGSYSGSFEASKM